MPDDPLKKGVEMTAEESASFFAMADKFLSIANGAVEGEKPSRISAAFMFACARFNAFAAQAQGVPAGEVDEETVEYFTREYEKMLRENLRQRLVSKS
ncbi:MAG: DUF3144 domain-containing protein [Pseudomonadota bacterium]